MYKYLKWIKRRRRVFYFYPPLIDLLYPRIPKNKSKISLSLSLINISFLYDPLYLQLSLDNLLLSHYKIRHKSLIDLPKKHKILLQIAYNQHLNQPHIDHHLEHNQTTTYNNNIPLQHPYAIQIILSPLPH